MANPVALNRDAHQNLRVITSRGARFGENVHIVPVVADELGSLVLDYPVCLVKNQETGQFGLSALLGFEPGENLYLQGDQWDAGYVPLHVRRQPFMLGFSSPDGEGRKQENALITIDLDSKRVQETEGESLFADDGIPTSYLQNIQNLLAGLMAGNESTKAFIDSLSEHELIEPALLNITFADGEQKRYEGIYTVSDQKLAELTGDTLQELHVRGYLQASYLLIASLGHVTKLISRKNVRRTAGK